MVRILGTIVVELAEVISSYTVRVAPSTAAWSCAK